MFILAEPVCLALYDNQEAGILLKKFSFLIPMLYCDTISDAITKGMGQQKICIRYNILTSALDVLLLYLLLPRYGMTGYYFSFTVTHLINFILSFRQLLRITEQTIPLSVPAFSVSSALLSAVLADTLPNCIGKSIAFPALFISMLILLRVLGNEDLQWIRQLFFHSQED